MSTNSLSSEIPVIKFKRSFFWTKCRGKVVNLVTEIWISLYDDAKLPK
jgi:hypothetical protein